MKVVGSGIEFLVNVESPADSTESTGACQNQIGPPVKSALQLHLVFRKGNFYTTGTLCIGAWLSYP